MTVKPRRDFRIVTHRSWLAEHFRDVGGVQDFGFDIDPRTIEHTVWWAPGAWVAAVSIRYRLPLLSCGPAWLDTVPQRYTRRRISTVEVDDAATRAESLGVPHVFIKLPEAKTDDYPARLIPVEIVDDNLPEVSHVQISTPLEAPLRLEARFFVAGDSISHGAVYRLGAHVWGSSGFDCELALHADEVEVALSELRKFVRELVADTEHPPGFVVDVGVLRGGDCVLIEANAAWSSNPYDTDPHEAYAAISAAHDFDGEHSRWWFDGFQVPPPYSRVRVVWRDPQ